MACATNERSIGPLRVEAAGMTYQRVARQHFASCWIGDRVLPIANACMNSFRLHGHSYSLFTYGAVAGVPDFVDLKDAEDLRPSGEVFVAHGGLETVADQLAYRFL